jgi:predicted DNA-binding WGR domain protein
MLSDAIDVATDLFGAWLVDMSYGRIGTIGRSTIRSFTTIEGAQDQVRTCLRKRATAPRRIGVAYHVRRVDRNEGWREPFDDQLLGWFPPTAEAASATYHNADTPTVKNGAWHWQLPCDVT